MNILPVRHPAESEYDMQDDIAHTLSIRQWYNQSGYEYHNGEVFREVKIPDIGRISDIIVFVTDRKIINVECKLLDYTTVLEQAKDHLKWCDYSYICLHADAYIPGYITYKILKAGIGLIAWRKGEKPTEVIQAYWNKNKDKELRTQVLAILKKKKKDKKREAEASKHIQNEINYDYGTESSKKEGSKA